ncbi:MAG: hypothetical protein AVDCRST_MAG68-3648, partial [uncultured Gemmatimonadetes bacterium]
ERGGSAGAPRPGGRRARHARHRSAPVARAPPRRAARRGMAGAGGR